MANAFHQPGRHFPVLRTQLRGQHLMEAARRCIPCIKAYEEGVLCAVPYIVRP